MIKLFKMDRFEAVGAFFALGVVAPILIMALDTDAPVSVVGWETPRAPIPRGAPFYPSYKVIYKRACSGESQRVFVDSTNHEMRTAPYRFRDGILADKRPAPIGVAFVPQIRAPVPYGAAPGPARYQSITRFYCNPLQKAFGSRFGLGITFRYPVVDLTIAPTSVPSVVPSSTVFSPVEEDDPAEIDDDLGAQSVAARLPGHLFHNQDATLASSPLAR